MKLNIPVSGDLLTLSEDCAVNLYPVTENGKFLKEVGWSQHFTVGMGKHPNEAERAKLELVAQTKGPEPGWHNPYYWKGEPLNEYYQQHYWTSLGRVPLSEPFVLPKGTVLLVKKMRLDKKESFFENYTVEFLVVSGLDGVVSEKTKLVLRVDDVNKLIGDIAT